MLRHELGATAKEEPRKEGADDGIADAYPRAGEAVFPTKLSSIADEDDGREITGAKGEGGEPRTDGTAAKDEAIDTLGLFA